jgi:DNA-binding NtrC family response regulator
LFVDEVGALDLDLQVKLLRVLQTREFYCLGGTDKRRFHGKLILAGQHA